MVIASILITLGIFFSIVSFIFLIKTIFQIKELKDKDIKIEIKLSKNKKNDI
ncbi:hypothetical protein JUNP543_0368 [Acinetobacter baumannii]|nr:hypothetical protein AB988_3546 [Acinetobacter baumannii]KMV09542.1 hypothetical protein AB988_3551 [Acinetobacter baumannii]